MKHWFFWHQWRTGERWLFWLVLALLLLIITYGAYAWVSGYESAIGWDLLSTPKAIPFVWDTVKAGPFELPLRADKYVVYETWLAGDLNVHYWQYMGLLGITAFSLCLLLAVATTARSFWFFAGAGVFILLLNFFGFSGLSIFGLSGLAALALPVVLYLPVAYYFHGLRPQTPLWIRLAVFTGITGLLTWLIYAFSEINAPLLYMAAHGLYLPLILGAIFCLLVAHEPVAALLRAVSGASVNEQGRSNGHVHFTLITFIYLINLILLYLYNTRKINWEILYVEEFLLLLISGLLAAYSMRHSSDIYRNLFRPEPEGLFLLAGLGLPAFGVIAFALATANDPLAEVMEDAIVYTHIGIGFVFFLYVLINFYDLLAQGLSVHKIIYKPMRVPFFTARLLGLIVASGFVFQNNYFTFYQALSGYQLALGDTYRLLGEEDYAAKVYARALGFEFSNHRGNYMLGRFNALKGNNEEAINFYNQAIKKRPGPQSYANLARLYEEENQFFDALFTLQEGLKEFPGHPRLQNNLGMLFAGKNFPDSAAAYLQAAIEFGDDLQQVAAANLEGLLAATGIELSEEENTGITSIENNALLANRLARYSGGPADLRPLLHKFNVLDARKFAVLNNYLLLPGAVTDSTLLKHIQPLPALEANTAYTDPLRLSYALGAMQAGYQPQGMAALTYLATESYYRPGYYYYLQGGLALKHQAPRLAATYFDAARDLQHQGATGAYALALLESGLTNTLDSLINNIDTLPDDPVARAIFQWQQQDIDTTIAGKVLSLRYKKFVHADTLLAAGVPDEMMGKIALQKAIEAFENEDLAQGEFYRQVAFNLLDIPAAPLPEAGLKAMAANTRYHKEIAEQASGLPEDPDLLPYRLLASAIEAELENKTEMATEKYRDLAQRMPFFEEGVLRASEYLLEEAGEELQAYQVLAAALQTNPYSIRLLKAFTMRTLALGMPEYADNGLRQLEQIMKPEAFKAFEQSYRKEAEERQRQAREWLENPAKP